MKAGNGWRPYEAVKPKRGHGGRDKVVEAGMRPLGPNRAAEAKRGRGGQDKAVEAERGRDEGH